MLIFFPRKLLFAPEVSKKGNSIKRERERERPKERGGKTVGAKFLLEAGEVFSHILVWV